MKDNWYLELLYELVPDFMADLYFGLSVPELLSWALIVLVYIVSHKA